MPALTPYSRADLLMLPLVLLLPFKVGVMFLVGPCGELEEVAVVNVLYWLCVALASIKGASSSTLSRCAGGSMRPAPRGMLRICTTQLIAKRTEIACSVSTRVVRLKSRAASTGVAGVRPKKLWHCLKKLRCRACGRQASEDISVGSPEDGMRRGCASLAGDCVIATRTSTSKLNIISSRWTVVSHNIVADLRRAVRIKVANYASSGAEMNSVAAGRTIDHHLMPADARQPNIHLKQRPYCHARATRVQNLSDALENRPRPGERPLWHASWQRLRLNSRRADPGAIERSCLCASIGGSD